MVLMYDAVNSPSNVLLLLFQARVLQTRSSQYLPLPLILSSFTVGVLWTLYGLLKQDTFITVSTFILFFFIMPST